MTPELIGLIVSIIGALFLFFGVIWGLIRGFKKSLFRGLWLFAIALIMFFVTPAISNAICGREISFLDIEVDGQHTKVIFEAIKLFLLKQEEIADLINNNPSLLPLLENLIVMAVNTVVFPIVFWIAKIITYPIWAIISAIVFKRKQKTVVNGKKLIVKYKKHRLSGMAIGLVAGAMVLVITFMPISGTINLLYKIDDLEYSKSENGEGIVTSMLGEETMGYIDSYSDSILGKALKYSGIEYISNSMYEFLSTKKIDDQKVTLSRELELYVTLYNDLNNIQTTDFNNLTKDSMSTFLNSSENIVKKLFSSSLLKIAGEDLIPYAIEFLENNESFNEQINSINSEELKELALESLSKFKTTNVNELQQDVLNIIYVAKALNDGDILVPTIYKELKSEDYIDLFTDSVVDQVTKYLFKMPSLNKIYPIALDTFFVFISDELCFDYTSRDYNENSLLQEDFANVIKGGLAVVRTIDKDSKYYITKSSFEATGKFLDILKNMNVLQDGMFDTIIDKSFEKGRDEIEKTDQSSNIKELLYIIVDEFENLIVGKETLLQNELKQYGVLFDDIKETVDEFNSSDKKELVLATYGRLLDKLNKTDLLMNIIPDIIEVGWGEIKDSFANATSELPNLSTVIDQIKDNILLVLENQNKSDPTISSPSNIQLSMETEFTQLQDFYDYIVDNILQYFEDGGAGINGLKDELFSEESNLVKSFGKQLDTMNTNLIITQDVLKDLMYEVFHSVKDDLSTETRVQKFIDDVVENMKNKNTYVKWEEELDYIKKLANYTKDGYSMDTIGEILDQVYKSAFIGGTLINDLIQEEIQAQYDNMSETLKNETTDNIIKQIKLNISKISSGIYATEIDYMLDMLDMIESSGDMTYSALGAKLDSFNDSFTISNVRPMMIVYAIDEKLKNEEEDSIIYKVLTEIKTNLEEHFPVVISSTFYTTQFDGINGITDITYPTSKDDLTKELLESIGTKLFEVSDISVYPLIFNLGDIVMNEILDQADYEDLTDVVESLRNNILDETQGILIVNRKQTNLNATGLAQLKTNYISCYTDLYELIDLYKEVDSMDTNEDASGKTIGDALDKVAGLSIVINNEDKTIARLVLDSFDTTIKDTIKAKAKEKRDEINDIPDEQLSAEAKQDLISEINTIQTNYTSTFTSLLNESRIAVRDKTSDTSYVTIFTTLINNINDVIDDVDAAINSISISQ